MGSIWQLVSGFLGGGGGCLPPDLQTQCSRDGFQKEPYAQSNLARLKTVGGWGGGAHCKHNARMMGFENTL